MAVMREMQWRERWWGRILHEGDDRGRGWNCNWKGGRFFLQFFWREREKERDRPSFSWRETRKQKEEKQNKWKTWAKGVSHSRLKRNLRQMMKKQILCRRSRRRNQSGNQTWLEKKQKDKLYVYWTKGKEKQLRRESSREKRFNWLFLNSVFMACSCSFDLFFSVVVSFFGLPSSSCSFISLYISQ